MVALFVLCTTLVVGYGVGAGYIGRVPPPVSFALAALIAGGGLAVAFKCVKESWRPRNG